MSGSTRRAAARTRIVEHRLRAEIAYSDGNLPCLYRTINTPSGIAARGVPLFLGTHNVQQTTVRSDVVEHTVAAVKKILEQVLQFDEFITAVGIDW